MALNPVLSYFRVMWYFVDLSTVPTVCHLLINGVLAYPKHTWSRDVLRALSRVGTRDALGACPHCWSRGLWSCELVARAPCFSGSRAGRVTWVTYVIFVFRLRICDSSLLRDVADCVHDTHRKTNAGNCTHYSFNQVSNTSSKDGNRSSTGICQVSINGFFAYPKRTWSHDVSCDLSHVGTHDTLGTCPHCWSRDGWSCEFMAHAPCFLGSCVGQVTWVTYVIFVFQLRIWDSSSLHNVTDCVHDSIPSLGSHCACNILVWVIWFDMFFSCRLNHSRSALALDSSFSGSQEFSDSG